MIPSKLTVAAAAVAILSLGGTAAIAGHHEKGEKAAMEASIVELAGETENLETFTLLVEHAGLADALSSGNYTVFAPSDEAFGALDTETLTDLQKPENQDKLRAILTNHVIEGEVMSAAVVGKQTTVATIGGGSLDVDGTDGVKIQTANVVKADVDASNGVIHIIDEVLVP